MNRIKAAVVALLIATVSLHAARSSWVPDTDEPLNGAFIMQNGCGAIGSALWRSFAQSRKFAIVGCGAPLVAPVAFYSATYDSVDIVLKQVGVASGHPELEGGFLCTWGGSRGGWWAMEIAGRHPARTVATCGVISGIWTGNSGAQRSIPRLFILGEKDNTLNPISKDITETLIPQREGDALYTVAVQWGLAHDYGNADQLWLPYLDQTLSQRLPSTPGASGTLKDCPVQEGWVGEFATWAGTSPVICKADSYTGDKKRTVWLPNRYVAYVWRAFMTLAPDIKLTTPLASGVFGPDMVLAADLVSPGKPNPSKVQFFDGDSLLGEKRASPFELPVCLSQGLHSIIAISFDASDSSVSSKPVAIMVSGLGEKWKIDTNGTALPAGQILNSIKSCARIGLTVEISDRYRAGAKYVWDYGDSSALDTTDSKSASHMYRKAGLFGPRVKVLVDGIEPQWNVSGIVLETALCAAGIRSPLKNMRIGRLKCTLAGYAGIRVENATQDGAKLEVCSIHGKTLLHKVIAPQADFVLKIPATQHRTGFVIIKVTAGSERLIQHVPLF